MENLKKENLVLWVVIVMMLVCLIGLLGEGCAPGNVCMNVPDGQDSVICALADEMATSPEAMSMILQIANVGALETSVYTAKEANEFIAGILTDLKDIKARDGKITYIEAIEYINKKFDLLPAKAQAAFLIVNPADLTTYKITLPLSDFDIGLIIRHLEQQAAIVRVYL